MFSEEISRQIRQVADEFGYEPAALLAIAEVESGGRALARVGQRLEPPIRFEGHYFDRRLTGQKQARARAEGLASPTAGKVANPSTQLGRWRMLERAVAIDAKAAYESVSWGLGQVMGAHWAWLGLASVEALVAEARSGAAGQVRLMARYIDKAGLADSLRKHDWEAFARGYNGPGYKRQSYHLKMASAHARHARHAAGPTSAPKILRQGMSGNDVRDLQLSLSALGQSVVADGVFGPQTARALRIVQGRLGLRSDSVAGPESLKAIAAALPAPPSGP